MWTSHAAVTGSGHISALFECYLTSQTHVVVNINTITQRNIWGFKPFHRSGATWNPAQCHLALARWQSCLTHSSGGAFNGRSAEFLVWFKGTPGWLQSFVLMVLVNQSGSPAVDFLLKETALGAHKEAGDLLSACLHQWMHLWQAGRSQWQSQTWDHESSPHLQPATDATRFTSHNRWATPADP